MTMMARSDFLKMSVAILFAAALLACTPADDEGAVASLDGEATRAAEAAEIIQQIEDTHPRADHVINGVDWNAAKQRFLENADTAEEPEYLVSLIELLSFFKDGHTTVPIGAALSQGKFPYRLPVRLRAFDDGLFVTDAKEEALPLLGGRVVSINGMAMNEIMEKFTDVWPADNVAWVQHDAGLLGLPALLAGLEVIDEETSPVLMQVQLEGGTMAEAMLTPDPQAGTDREALPRTRSPQEVWAGEASETNYVRIIEDRSAIYLSLNEVQGSSEQSFDDLTALVATQMQNPAADRIIIDLRRNGGGDNTLAEPLRRVIAASRFNHPGGIVVLIAPQTFSAAANVAARFERDTFAIFVGGPTGAGPNHFGDASAFTGKSSGLLWIVSTLHWQDSTPFDTRAWIMPDVAAPMIFADWAAGRDPALEIALGDNFNALQLEDYPWYAPWEKPSQQVAWAPFWRQ